MIAASIKTSTTDLVASICRESYYDFLQEFWYEITPEEPVWNWHIRYLCRQMQHAAERVFKGLPKEEDYIFNVPPGTTKSIIASIAFVPWTWTRMPSARHIDGSHTDTLSLDLSRKCRDIVKSDKYKACFPEVRLREDQDTKGYFANTKKGDRFSCTVGGRTPTGHHAHFITIDDPIDPQRAASEAELKSANEWMSETLPSRKINKEITPTFLIMQRVHQNDPSGNRLEKAEQDEGSPVKHICLPAEESDLIHPPTLRKYYRQGLLDPRRLGQKVLDEARGDLGEYGYAGQYDQNPVPRKGGMFKVDRFQLDTPNLTQPFVRIVRYWDKAGTAGGGAYTVGVLMAVDYKGRYWVLDVVRGQWGTDEREEIILDTARIDRSIFGRRVKVWVEQEPGSGGKDSANMTIRNLAGFSVKADPVGQSEGNKELRADPFSAQVNGNNVFLWEHPEGAGLLKTGKWMSQYIEEFRFFPASKYKDQVDASSGAFNKIAAKRVSLGAL